MAVARFNEQTISSAAPYPGRYIPYVSNKEQYLRDCVEYYKFYKKLTRTFLFENRVDDHYGFDVVLMSPSEEFLHVWEYNLDREDTNGNFFRGYFGFGSLTEDKFKDITVEFAKIITEESLVRMSSKFKALSDDLFIEIPLTMFGRDRYRLPPLQEESAFDGFAYQISGTRFPNILRRFYREHRHFYQTEWKDEILKKIRKYLEDKDVKKFLTYYEIPNVCSNCLRVKTD